MRKVIIIYLTVFIHFQSIASTPVLKSGKPIQNTNSAAPFRGPGLGNKLIGTAFTSPSNNNRPDIFIQHTVPLKWNKEVLLYRWQYDTEDGRPVFDSGTVITHQIAKQYTPRYLFQTKDHSIHCIWTDSKSMIYSILDIKELTFKETDKFDVTQTPQINNTMTALSNFDGSTNLIFSVSHGNYMGWQALKMHTRGNVYDPFDGAGIWRGEMPTADLYTISLTDIQQNKANSLKKITSSSESVLLHHGWSMTTVNLGKGHERDIITGSMLGNFYYFQNISLTNIEIAKSGYIIDPQYTAIRHPANSPSPIAYPNFKTGLSDLLVTSEGWMSYYQFTGEFKDEMPVYKALGPALKVDGELTFGTLPVINVVDWNGDNLPDIISGNSHGTVLLAENKGTKDKPCFITGKKLTVNNTPILIQPGYSGSIQGPMEARWGYTCPTVTDWNSDGLPDMLLSSTEGRHLVYINNGTKEQPNLTAPTPLYCNGLDLHGTWRVQAAVGEIKKQMAYITLDDQDEFHLYWRIDDYNVRDGGKLHLTDGSVIQANYRYAGGTGRLKLHLADWDQDGHKDLIVGTMLESSVPCKKSGLPSSLGNVGAMPLFLRNSGSEELKFENPRVFQFNDKHILLGIHSCSPVVADLDNDKKLDLIVGEETGRVLFYAHDEITFSNVKLLDNIVPNCIWQKTTIDSSWHNNLNWWRGIPDKKSNAIIKNKTSIVLDAMNTYCKNLSLSGNSSLTIDKKQILNIFDKLTLEAQAPEKSNIIINGGKLKASIIDFKSSNNNITISQGNIITKIESRKKIEEYIAKGNIRASSPKDDISITTNGKLIFISVSSKN
ncbi:MAG: hypothetical protein ACIAQZ_01280 [Sedimentisphaeraceae bacterium JB056]